MKQYVTSREYKVMLKEECFVGSQDNLLEIGSNFWNDFKDAIQDIAIDTDGSLNQIKKQRKIKFYDSTDNCLRENSYVFRERIDLNTDKRQVTLKYRHPDRYISQDRDMAAAVQKNGETKFEEDIKLPFLKLYSFSTKQTISDGKNINKLKDIHELYPDIKKQLKSYEKDIPINLVGDFIARELVITGADFQIKKSPKVEAECALVVWYDDSSQNDIPVVVEFSFRYTNEREEYDGKAAQRAYDIFNRLKNLEQWVNPQGQTKTSYVYSRAQVIK